MDLTSYLLGKKKGGGGSSPTLISKDITTNGVYFASDDNADGYSELDVDVQPNLQNKSVTITSNTTINISPDTGYDGLGIVEITTNVSSGTDYFVDVANESENAVALIKHIESFDTTGRTSFVSMFQNCANLIDIPLIDTSNGTQFNQMFQNCAKLQNVPLLNLSNAEFLSNMFQGCSSLTTIPQFNTTNATQIQSMFHSCTNLTTIPPMDTSNATNAASMFNRCTNLTTIPEFNMEKCTSMSNMFSSCGKLTDNSLNNILAMCASATNYGSAKTLINLGLSSAYYPASRIQALSNYQDFINAGWTIGWS